MPPEVSHVPVLAAADRDALFNKLREDEKFRELVKKDWRRALTSMNIKPEAVAKGMLSRSDVESFAGQRASWTIEIVIFARNLQQEAVEMKEAVAFEAR